MKIAPHTRPYGLNQRIAILLMVGFVIVFPKGGVKIGGVPITWGYILIALLTILWLPKFLWNLSDFKISKERLYLLLSLAPLQVYLMVLFLGNGISSVGFGLSMILNVIIIPIIFIVLWKNNIESIDLDFFQKTVRNALLFVALYGIFLFFYKYITGDFIEIPYLTVNLDDYGHLESKFINRGGIFKLISTYNNGNIFGVTILMLLPFYQLFEKSRFKCLVLKAALVLTLSRTVWAGLVFFELTKFLFRVDLQNKAFLRNLFWYVVTAVILVFAIVLVTNFIGLDYSFLFDSSLGNRIDQFDILNDFKLISDESFQGIGEIVYLSILDQLGLIGLIFFISWMFSPIVLGFFADVPFGRGNYKKSLVHGLLIYCFCATSDGAFLFIPVQVVFWLIVSLLISNNKNYDSRFF